MGREHVVLVHGLGETPAHMAAIAAALRAGGYDITNLSYPSTTAPTAVLAEHFLTPLMADLAHAPRLHVVTHSMGGIMLRHSLATTRPANLGRVVMTAPGNHGSAVLELYRRTPAYRLLLGPSGQEAGLHDHCYACALPEPVDYEVGIIAGTMAFDPVASVVLRWPNDGRLDLDGVRLAGMRDLVTVPAGHDLLAFHPLTVFQVLQFLRHGRFFREFDPRHYVDMARDTLAALPKVA